MGTSDYVSVSASRRNLVQRFDNEQAADIKYHKFRMESSYYYYQSIDIIVETEAY